MLAAVCFGLRRSARYSRRMAGPQRTMIAQQATNLSIRLAGAFMQKRVGSERPMQLLLRVPDGPSTGGGKTARQSLLLVEEGAAAGSGVMIGWIDVAQQAAELRDYSVVSDAYVSRFKADLPVTRYEYEQFTKEIEKFITDDGFIVDYSSVKSAAAEGVISQRPGPARRPPPWFWLVAISSLLVVAAAVGVMLLS